MSPYVKMDTYVNLTRPIAALRPHRAALSWCHRRGATAGPPINLPTWARNLSSRTTPRPTRLAPGRDDVTSGDEGRCGVVSSARTITGRHSARVCPQPKLQLISKIRVISPACISHVA